MKSKIVFSVVALALILNVFFPQITKAQEASGKENDTVEITAVNDVSFFTDRFAELRKQAAELNTYKVKRVMTVTSTAYNSEVGQCDSTPCITADGYNVCKAGVENVVAANFLPFGTKIKIPEIFGDRIFTVHDRMNKRFSSRVDIWMLSRANAIQYGKRTIKIEILE